MLISYLEGSSVFNYLMQFKSQTWFWQFQKYTMRTADLCNLNWWTGCKLMVKINTIHCLYSHKSVVICIQITKFTDTNHWFSVQDSAYVYTSNLKREKSAIKSLRQAAEVVLFVFDTYMSCKRENKLLKRITNFSPKYDTVMKSQC